MVAATTMTKADPVRWARARNAPCPRGFVQVIGCPPRRQDDGATISVRSLSPLGERVGVRGLQNHRETLTPHPPLSLWEREQIEPAAPLMIRHHDSSHGETALPATHA